MMTLPNPAPKIRVLVADAMAMSCHLLADALQRSERYYAIAAATPQEALEFLRHSDFDVVLVGIGLSEDPLDSVSFVRQLRGLHPEASIVVLLDALDRTIVVEAFRAGAGGVFCRTEAFETLCKCIRRVHQGQVWVSSTGLHFVLEALVEHGTASQLSGSCPLSKREDEITSLVAEGFSNRQISERLGLSEHTIKNYLFRVFEKLGVNTRVGLTLYALQRGKTPPAKLQSIRPVALPLPRLLPDSNSDLS